MFEFVFLCALVGGGVWVLKKNKKELRRKINEWLEEENKEG